MSRILILRPQPGADATARKVKEAGFEPLLLPLFAVEKLAWSPPDPARFDSLMLTSANAARMAGPGLSLYANLPLYCVGAATARAAELAGLTISRIAGPDGAALVHAMVEAGRLRALHLAGRDTRALPPSAMQIERIAVYDSVEQDADLAGLVQDGAIIFVHSPRAGRSLARRIHPDQRRQLHIIAISENARTACGTGWQSSAAAAEPDDSAMLALAQEICH